MRKPAVAPITSRTRRRNASSSSTVKTPTTPISGARVSSCWTLWCTGSLIPPSRPRRRARDRNPDRHRSCHARARVANLYARAWRAATLPCDATSAPSILSPHAHPGRGGGGRVPRSRGRVAPARRGARRRAGRGRVGLRDADGDHRGRAPGRRRHRHPHAADRQRRRHPRRRGRPRDAPGDGRRRAQPVRRVGVRPQPARERVRAARLPPQGARPPPRPARRRGPRRAPGRLVHRPEDRRAARPGPQLPGRSRRSPR